MLDKGNVAGLTWKILLVGIVASLLVIGGLGISQSFTLQVSARATLETVKKQAFQLEAIDRKLDSLSAQMAAIKNARAEQVKTQPEEGLGPSSATQSSPQPSDEIAVDEFDVVAEMSAPELAQLDTRIRNDRLRRFEASLNDEGLRELERRYERVNENLSGGKIPGFEGFAAPLPRGHSKREIQLREEMRQNRRMIALREMYMEHRFRGEMDEFLKNPSEMEEAQPSK